MGEVTIYFPFCQKYGVKAFETPSYRARDHASQYSSKRGDQMKILSACPSCGKTDSEIQKKI